MPNGKMVERIKEETQGGIHRLELEPLAGTKKDRDDWRKRN